MSQCVCDGTIDPAKYITHLERELAARDAEVTRLWVDAERYRWFRQHHGTIPWIGNWVDEDDPPERLDAAIDALAQPKEPTCK